MYIVEVADIFYGNTRVMSSNHIIIKTFNFFNIPKLNYQVKKQFFKLLPLIVI